jgi:uncharacterized cupredoxin-like copper-binding protein
MEIGQPGNKHINRSVTVKMSETENGMIFKPDQLSFKAGQTIKIKRNCPGCLIQEKC